MSALSLVGCEFDPQLGLTKDYKNSTHFLPARHSEFWVGLGEGGIRSPKIPGRGPAASRPSIRRLLVKHRVSFLILQDCKMSGGFNLPLSEHVGGVKGYKRQQLRVNQFQGSLSDEKLRRM